MKRSLCLACIMWSGIVASNAEAFPKAYSKHATLFVGETESVLWLGAGGRWLVPVSPDGPFPEYSATTAIFLSGFGRQTSIGGRTGMSFDFSDHAWDRHGRVKRGRVFITADRTLAEISVSKSEEGWPAALNGQARIERVSAVLTGSEAEIYLDFFGKRAEELIRFGLENLESKTSSGVAVSDLVISFLFNEHIGTFDPGAACELRGVVIIWNGNKGAEYPILEAPAPKKKQFLASLSNQQLSSPYLDGWQVKWGRTSRTPASTTTPTGPDR